ncbi:MAG: tetratricopeptide repeat protein [Betaproteobacteria bacterium]
MSSKRETLEQAIEHHMAGRLDQAERLYLMLQTRYPNDEEILYLLGVLSCDVGIPDAAYRFLDQALTLCPGFVDARHQLGLAFAQAGRHQDALAQFDLVLQSAPERIASHIAAAEALSATSREQQAAARLEQLVALDNNADAWRMLAKVELQRHDPARAEACCLASLAVAPDQPDTLNYLGLARLQQRKFGAAVEPLARALELAPEANQARNNLGTALRKLGRVPEAQMLFEQALMQDPSYVEARANLADALRVSGHLQEARAHLEQVVAAAPRMLSALNNYAVLLQDLGEHAEALAVLERASALAPDTPQVRWNRALSELATGNYAQGWANFEARWEGCENLRGGYTKPPERAWRGEPIAGKRVLLWAEQGFGDTLQFVRFARDLSERGATVILEAQPELVTALRTVPHLASVIARGEPLPEYDVHCPLLSLPHRLELTLGSLPVTGAYLMADADLEQRWAERLADYQHPRVGLVWAGRARPGAVDLAAIDARRSLSFAQLAAITAVSGVQFFSLQKDGDQPGNARPNCVDFSAEWRDFADTAAFVANLDLVISVDTAVAHLAAAMGKPVWLLNRYDSCWRWLRDRDDSPWYPTLVQFRQPKPGDWATPVRQIADGLKQWLANRPRAAA